jgi:tetratricopeptide (TPR) repeat protein
VIKSLLEVGALRQAGEGYVLAKRLDEIFIPDTIQDVIMARIDRLEEAQKRTLQLASVIYSLAFAGQLKNWRGEYAEALPLQAESLRIAREHNLLMPLLFVIWDTGLVLTGKGDYDEALARFEEGLLLSEKVGAEIRRLRFLNSLG